MKIFIIEQNRNKSGYVRPDASPEIQCVIIHPWFITGFSDGEGCFTLSFVDSKQLKVGWMVKLRFQISLHEKDIALLKEIKNYLGGVGKIYRHSKKVVQFKVETINELQNPDPTSFW